MDKLYRKCRYIIANNVATYDSGVINVLSLSLMSLFLTMNEKDVRELISKLPTLRIYSDNRSVIDVAHKELNNYRNDDDLRFAVAALIREVYFKDGKPYETRNMIIPRKNINDNPIEVVEATTHELVHLLRYGDTYVSNGEYLTFDGIAQKRLNIAKGETQQKNKILEESIVQKQAKDSTQALLEYLDSVHTFNRTVNRMKKKKESYESLIYDIPVHLLEMFYDNPEFKELVSETYASHSSKRLESYYNTVMGDSQAFTKLNDAFDVLFLCIQRNDTNGIRKLISHIAKISRTYKGNIKIYKKS